MAINLRNRYLVGWMLAAIAGLLLTPMLYAGNQVMGEVIFEGKSKVEKTSGVWVDGQYVGYLKELKGSKKVLLLPGDHTISVRQDGYQDFVQKITLQPGEKRVVSVAMVKGVTGAMPSVTATLKISVNPNRAAVFVDGLFVGHVGEFDGAGRGMLVAPGQHTIRIALPGYQTFETQINPQPHQKVEVKTDLVKSEGSGKDPLLNGSGSGQVTAPEPANAPQRLSGNENDRIPPPQPANGTLNNSVRVPPPATAPMNSPQQSNGSVMDKTPPAQPLTGGVIDSTPPPPPEPANQQQPQ